MTATISDSSPDIPSAYRVWVATAFLLGAMARDTFGDPNAAGRALLDYTADARGLEVLTHGETRVLHYLPTNLSAREIAGELYLSVNTVKTHQRHLYQKLGACSRTQAVEQGPRPRPARAVCSGRRWLWVYVAGVSRHRA